MALNYTELVTEVTVEIGKQTDVILATGTRIGRYVNWAQRAIVRKWPGLRSANVVDKTSVACVTDQCEYDLAALLADAPLAHIISVRYIDTAGANYRRILPFSGGTNWFDEMYPYPKAQATGIPEYYVRRGDTLELFPVPGASQNTKPIWLEYSKLPAVLTGTDTPLLTDFDEEIIQVAVWRALTLMSQTDDKLAKIADAQGQTAWQLVAQRVESEAEFGSAKAGSGKREA